MGSHLSFELPRAFCERGESSHAKAVSLMAKAEAHLLALRRQSAFFALGECLASDYPSVQSFSFSMGSHYNDEGYSDHINMRVEYLDEDGKPCVAESNEEYGSLPEEAEHLDELRYFVGNLDDDVVASLVGKRIDCKNERALAEAVMGPEGFAHFEAENIERAAHAGTAGQAEPPRL